MYGLVFRWLPVLGLLGFAFVVQSLVFVTAQKVPGTLVLSEPDCYMRLVRVLEWKESGQWQDHLFDRSNAPFGETTHWTRPMDLLLRGGGELFSLVMPWGDGLFAWAVVVSPLLGAVALLVWLAGMGPMLKGGDRTKAFFFGGLLFVMQLGAFLAFMAGRPDHHGLLLLLFVLAVVLMSRIVRYRVGGWIPAALGVCLALSMWVSVETLPLLLWCMGGLCLFAFWEESVDFMGRAVVASVGLFIGMGMALMVEYPLVEWKEVRMDTLSVLHVAMAGVLCAGLVMVWGVRKFGYLHLGRVGRMAIGVALALGVLAFPVVVFDGVTFDLFAALPDEVKSLWLANVNEVLPVWTNAKDGPPRFFIWVAGGIAGLIYSLIRLYRERTPFWLMWVLGMAGYLALSMVQIRWVYYVSVLSALPLYYIFRHGLHYLESVHTGIRLSLLRVAWVIAAGMGFVFLGMGLQMLIAQVTKPQSTGTATHESAPTQLATLTEFANEIKNRDTMRIAAMMDLGPELLYRTKHEVIATPYHRNGHGILDVWTLMTSNEETIALEIIRNRGITHLLITHAPAEGSFFTRKDGKTTLRQRLLDGTPPPWLAKEPLNEKLNTHFSLYRVIL